VKEVPKGVSILNYHYAHPPDAVAQNWQHNVVIGFDETGFQGHKAPFYRKTAWDFLLAGGSVYSNLDWSFSVASPKGQDLTADEKLGPKDPELRPQLGALKQFMDGLPLVNMKPIANIVQGELPKGVTVRGLTDGETYAFYIKGDGLIQLRLQLPKARLQWEWIDPVTARVTRIVRKDHPGGIAVESLPGYFEDIVLRLFVNK
jgi:hypothetical protein